MSTRIERQDYQNLIDLFGSGFLAYLLNVEEDAEGEKLANIENLSDNQVEALDFLARRFSGVENSIVAKSYLSPLAQYNHEYGTSTLNEIRRNCGGIIPTVSSEDSLLIPLYEMLVLCYPLFLLKPSQFPPAGDFSSALWQSPHNTPFQEAWKQDAALEKFGKKENFFIASNSGSGGSLPQEILLPALIFDHARWLAHIQHDLSIDTLAAIIASIVDGLKRLLLGNSESVRALVGFAGVLFDGFSELTLSFGTLHKISDEQEFLIPKPIGNSLNTNGADGSRINVRYGGDVYLETSFELEVSLSESSGESTPQSFTSENDARKNLERQIQAIRLALLLTFTDDPVCIAHDAWRRVFDPLNWGPTLGYNDLSQHGNISPRKLDSESSTRFVELVELIYKLDLTNIDIAIDRLLSGFAGRRDVVDSIVDLVISWEVLLGGRPETKFRVSAAIARLLENSPQDREEIAGRISRIYDFRSDAVHGRKKSTKEEERGAILYDAHDISLRLFQSLFEVRPELLAVKSPTRRSTMVILGE